ncbi:unnamed protein product [Mytilus edulis]|uniref:Uncharacterized protein n=1 Tax=Mytilus edulis TaxID=6550 RepID=A0A8S3RI44_MYTED|nr:unnamed protein product [Mytilus edulis]
MNGPQWLTDERKWPTWTGHVEISTQLSNITGPKTHRSDDKIPSDPPRISQIIDMNRYSDLNKLLTVTGYALKFVKNCQKKRPYRLRSSQGDRNLRTSLTKEDISLAMDLWIKDTQQDRFVKELEHISLNPKVKSLPLVQQLRLYLDENGIIRYLQSAPDHEFKWIMHYQDHLTKSVLRALKSKRAAKVAYKLLDIFLLFGVEVGNFGYGVRTIAGNLSGVLSRNQLESISDSSLSVTQIPD